MTISNFYNIVEKTINLEGGYVNNPNDPGGETNFGITIGTAKNFGYTGQMKDLTKQQALEIYKKGYWDINSLDLISDLDIQFEIFDSGVNCGVKNPATWTQKIINAMNYNESWWKDIQVDGCIGPQTAQIINNICANKKFKTILFNSLNAYQTVYYIEICIANPKLEQFLYGWINNRTRFMVQE